MLPPGVVDAGSPASARCVRVRVRDLVENAIVEFVGAQARTATAMLSCVMTMSAVGFAGDFLQEGHDRSARVRSSAPRPSARITRGRRTRARALHVRCCRLLHLPQVRVGAIRRAAFKHVRAGERLHSSCAPGIQEGHLDVFGGRRAAKMLNCWKTKPKSSPARTKRDAPRPGASYLRRPARRCLTWEPSSR